MMPTHNYRWGFVGAGWMAWAQASDLQLLERGQVAGVVSATEESAQAFARDFGARAYPDLDAMLADPAIDLIHVTTPNHLHHPQTKAALLAGKPVLCEKPFTLNAVQAADLVATARAEKVFLMEAMWVRCLPLVARLRELLAAGAIGDLRELRASFHAQIDFDPSSRIYDPAMGGGALLDLGIYPIAWAAMLFGSDPEQIHSQAHIGPTGVDENFSATLHFRAGQQAQVSAGVDSSVEDAIEISGEHGSIRVFKDDRAWKLSRMQLSTAAGVEAFELPYLGSGYAHQAQEVMQRLDAGDLESAAMPLEESVAIMRTLDALRAQWGLVFPGE